MSAQHEGDSNKLNRELLRWIQSLDLAYSIKNVKRDFSNGFLVAEIMSRYYDKDISMHSYDNGIGIKVKKDNWDQLAKLFGRFSDLEPLTSKADIDALIHCRNGAAVGFLTKLYQCLTKRTIHPTSSLPQQFAAASSAGVATPVAKATDAVENIPPYAKTTGSTLIREKMRDSDIAEMNDETEINRKVRTIHNRHEETLQLERLMPEMPEMPDRYPSIRSASKATVLRGATRPVRNDDSPTLMTQHVVKEVQIKSMNEKSLEKLRVTREAKEKEALGGSVYGGHSGTAGASFDSHGGRGRFSMNGGGGGSAPDLIQKRKPMDLLNEAVARKLSSMGLLSKLEQRSKDKFEAFVDALFDGQQFSDQESADILTDVVDEEGLLALAFVEYPKEFWKFMGLLYPLLTENEDEHLVFLSTLEVLRQIGHQCVQRDSAIAALLMSESILPKIISDLREHATKRAPLLQVVYSFVPDSVLAHIQTIKRLREGLPDDIPVFIHTLSILLYMENDLDDTLVDLYYYYCCIGLEAPCEKLRAACLSMLVPLVSYDLSLVVDLLPRLTQFSSRYAWWEVKGQLLIVSSAFLHSASKPPAQDSDRDLTDQIELALTIIEREFHPSANMNMRRIGLTYLAKNLYNYQELVPLYVDVLFSLPPVILHVMLRQPAASQSYGAHEEETGSHESFDEIKNELPIRGTSGARYKLMPLPEHWDSIAMAKQIFYERKSQDHADFEVIYVLHSCFEQLHSTDRSEDAKMLYDQMKGFLVLGVLDAGGCALVAQIIKRILRSAPGYADDIFQHDVFIESLQKLVTKNVDDIRQQSVTKLLRESSLIDLQCATSVQRCVQTLRSLCNSHTFNASLFALTLDT
uniref:Spermatogenesis-associated protein 4 n=1 Tax=Globisporangium ultimum (strain ATCC 200006 / CBS 805.95 / DAOM BR144) TaxID=431595 RepID=K3WR73_GLOUD